MFKLRGKVNKVILWVFLIVCIANALLLAFAYRDFSWALVAMAFASVVGLPLNIYFLIKVYDQRQPSWFSLVTDSENLINHYGYPDQLADDRKYTDEDEDEDGLDLEGRFCINP